MSEPIYAIGYARISDPSQLKGDGLLMQEQAIQRFADTNNLTFFPKNKVEQDIFTGRKVHVSKRPKYIELRNLILANPNKIKYFVIARIDRSVRSGSDDYLFMKNDLASLGVALRDAQNIIQPNINTLAHRDVAYD